MTTHKHIAIIGGGPSGLMAAEVLASNGHNVTIYDRMPTLGRKFLMAGRGGLNLTHSEPLETFITRYGNAAAWIAPYINAFTPTDLRNWCEGLGQETFIGSSGRVFPKSMKASPLLRAWLARLNQLGVKFAPNHTWQGWENGSLKFTNAEQKAPYKAEADTTLLALGGASWPRLGSNGGWVKILEEQGIKISPLLPANCGFVTSWSEYFSSRFAGTPLKAVTISHNKNSQQGDIMITANGLEGGAIYALSSSIRKAIIKNGKTEITIDLRPIMSEAALVKKLSVRGKQSFSNYLRKAGFSPVIISLLHEIIPPEKLNNPEILAATIKALPITLTAINSIERAISTAGGIALSSINNDLMLTAKPGVFVTGEMLDWEAPTGGYLLQGCFSTAIVSANGILQFLKKSV
jgi:uncharacterized flavoprotein (TIGR03862 family)